MNRALVVDVEATCWQRRHPPQGEQTEIIEIGICALDLDRLEPGPTHSLLVKPQRSTVSSFCTQLTSITPEMAAQGLLFDAACALLEREYDAGDGVWCSWGHFDRRIFERQCRNFEVRYPFSACYVNLKKRLAILQRGNRKGKPRQISFMKALGAAGLAFEGDRHRAGSDAWNTARLLAALVGHYGQDRVLGC